MDPISNLISTRADDLFKSPAYNTMEEPIIDLEAQVDSQISYIPADDILFQEEIKISPPVTMEVTQTPVEEKKVEKANSANVDLTKLKTMINSMRDQLDAMLRFINGDETALPETNSNGVEIIATGETIVEGIFDGEKMIDASGKEYAVAPNYASKSKLVEGDKMKLTITTSGRFIYKQIVQIDRKRLVGELTLNNTNDQWNVLADGKNYKVLAASVTFYKGISGDEVVFFVPRNVESTWGAVEHIIHKK